MHQFADFWLEEELARGGMGVVYRARHMQTGRPCALKLVLSGNRATATQIHRFKREALAQASLNHPGILRIFDGGECNGNLYFSMELAEGGDILGAIEWSLERKVELISKIARALGFAHEQGYVHRDLKPANVLLTREGEPKLTDFGLTKRLDSNTMLTQEGALMGTPFYMSPEQAQGHGSSAGPTSDVFSLGVLLYHFVTGELPFAGNTTVQLLSQIVDGDQEPFAKHDIDDQRLELICCKAMEKDPADRYPHGTAVAEDLERWLRGDDPTASRASSFSRIARKAVEHKTAASVIVLVITLSLLAVGGIGGVVAYAFAQAEHEAAVSRWRVEARALARELEAEASAEANRLPLLIGARERAMALLSEDPSTEEEQQQERPDREALSAALRAALARELDNALLVGTVGALEHATQAYAAAGLSDSPELAQRAARLRAANGEPGSPWATANALWSADQSPSGDEVEQASEDSLAGPAVLRARGARRARAGKQSLAERSWAPLLESESADELCALARVCWSCGAREFALDAWTRALERDPACAPAALALARCAPRLGQAAQAHEALADAADSSPGVALARVLLASEREPSQLEKLPKRSQTTSWGELVLGDTSDASTSSPYADAVGLAGRAAHARWLAEHEQPDAARAALAELSLLEGGPRPGGEPAPALIRRALCHLGGAYSALGEREPALAALEVALRSDPHDLEAHALRAALEPDLEPVRDAFAAAARRELISLDSALARGVFVARAARASAIQHEFAQPDAGSAPLLEHGTLGRPALRKLLSTLAAADPAPMAGAWVPIVPQHDAAGKQSALAQWALKGSDVERVEIIRKAMELDPLNVAIRFDYSRSLRHVRAALPCYLERVRAIANAPYSVFGTVILFRENWGLTASGGLDPGKDVQAFLEKDPADTAREVVWVIERYHGVLYPDDVKPNWSDGQPKEVIDAIDRVLARDARYFGLLFVRAHMLDFDDDPQAADHDLDLAFKLGGDPTNSAHPHTRRTWGELHQAWLLTANRPKQAIEALSKIPEITVTRDTAAGRLGEFLTRDEYFSRIRDAAPLRRLLNTLKTK